MRRALVVSALAALASLAACTTPTRPFLRATRPNPLPPAWSPDPTDTPVDQAAVRAIHAQAMAVFVYLPDAATPSERTDVWKTPAQIEHQIGQRGRFTGDCEDFATWCAHLARLQGLPARLVLCLTEDRQAHCVAEVTGWVLCNRQPRAMPAQDLPYTWIKASGYHPGDPWTRITLAPPDPSHRTTTKPASSGLFY